MEYSPVKLRPLTKQKGFFLHQAARKGVLSDISKIRAVPSAPFTFLPPKRIFLVLIAYISAPNNPTEKLLI